VQQTRLAEAIDTHVTQVLTHGGGDEALLLSLADYMPTFKQLLDTCTGEEMNMLCDRYDHIPSDLVVDSCPHMLRVAQPLISR